MLMIPQKNKEANKTEFSTLFGLIFFIILKLQTRSHIDSSDFLLVMNSKCCLAVIIWDKHVLLLTIWLHSWVAWCLCSPLTHCEPFGISFWKPTLLFTLVPWPHSPPDKLTTTTTTSPRPLPRLLLVPNRGRTSGAHHLKRAEREA